MDRTQGVITPERFASGMTFTQYLDFIATPRTSSARARAASRGAT